MSIDLQVHGDGAAVSAAGTMVEDMAQALTDAATDLTGLRGEADGAWDGYASRATLQTFGSTQGELSQFGEEVTALGAAISALGTALEGVADDLDALRPMALGGGLTTTATTIEYPMSVDASSTPEDISTHTQQAEHWEYLQGLAEGYRRTEANAHEALTDAVGTFLAAPVVVDILQRVGFMPSGDSPHDIGSWLAGLGLTGAGWTADWWTSLRTGIYRPRSPGGQFRASAGRGSWREALASTKSNNWGARANQAVTNKRWAAAGKWAGRAGTAISFGTAAWGQWQSDADDPSMGWEEQGARAATVGAATAAGGWAGGWAGAKVGAGFGFLIGGPVGGAIGGIVGGLIGGAIGSGVGEWVGDKAKDAVGGFVDAISFWN